jgi:hypothetical protein
MANECIITVKGRDKGRTERDPAGRGNTTRPWRDQTRPLSQFIRGMGCYAGEMARHIVGCEKCDPNMYLAMLTNHQAIPATFGSGRFANILMRDKRTDPVLALQIMWDSHQWHLALAHASKLPLNDWYRILHDSTHQKGKFEQYKIPAPDRRRDGKWMIKEWHKILLSPGEEKFRPEKGAGRISKIPRAIREITARVMYLKSVGSALPDELYELDDYIMVHEIMGE